MRCLASSKMFSFLFIVLTETINQKLMDNRLVCPLYTDYKCKSGMRLVKASSRSGELF